MNVNSFAATIALLASLTSAYATNVTTIYTGVVTNIDDPDHLFGDVQINQPFIERFVFDPSQWGQSLSGPGLTYLLGGTSYGAPGFVVDADVTIDGTTWTVPTPAYDAQFYGKDTSSASGEFRDARYFNQTTGSLFELTGDIFNPNNNTVPGWPFQSFSYDAGPGDTTTVNNYASMRLCSSGDCSSAMIDASVTNIANVVPEPPTWALMVLGFAGFGFVGYRRGQSVRRREA